MQTKPNFTQYPDASGRFGAKIDKNVDRVCYDVSVVVRMCFVDGGGVGEG